MNVYQMFHQFLQDFFKHYPRNVPQCRSEGCYELEWKGTGYCWKCLDYSLRRKTLDSLGRIEAALGGEALDRLKEAQDRLADGLVIRGPIAASSGGSLPEGTGEAPGDGPGFIPSDVGRTEADVSLKGGSRSTSKKKNAATAAARLREASGGP